MRVSERAYDTVRERPGASGGSEPREDVEGVATKAKGMVTA